MKNILLNRNGHRRRALGVKSRNRNHGLGRFSLTTQIFLLIWMFVSTAVAAFLLWTHHKSWLLAMFASLASFIWQARLTVAELFLEVWVFILRILGRKE
jgi:hypothetical protein